MDSNPLFLVTHAHQGGIFDEGLLKEDLVEAVNDYPGTTIHISETSISEPPYGGEELYDEVIQDEGKGKLSRETCKEILNYRPIVRAGTQFDRCCARTDMSLAELANEHLEMAYLTDLTVEYKNEEVRRVSDSSSIERPTVVEASPVLNFSYSTYFSD